MFAVLDDEVVDALYKNAEAIDEEIKINENTLRQLESANRDLFKLLIKSQPLNSTDSWAPNGKFSSLTCCDTMSFPSVSDRNAWIPCPLRLNDKWIHVIRENVVIGVEVENIQDNMCLADITVNIMISNGENKESDGHSWTCCLKKFDSEFVPQETNLLRPNEKAFLISSTIAPSTLLTSEFILVFQAFVKQGDHSLLPPAIDPEHWRPCSGELCRMAIDNIINDKNAHLVIRKLTDILESQDVFNGSSEWQKVVASIYANQRHKQFYLQSKSGSAVNVILESPDLPLSTSTRYCRLPLFDGILIFTLESPDSIGDGCSLLISGWNVHQIDQFVEYLRRTLSDEISLLEDYDDKQHSETAILNTEGIAEKFNELVMNGTDVLDDEDSKTLVDGHEYRKFITEVTADFLKSYITMK